MFSISSSIAVLSRSLNIVADDLVVVGLQNCPISGIVSSVGAVDVCPALSGLSVLAGGMVLPGGFRGVAVLVVGADVLSATIMVLTAVVLSFKLCTLSRHFFFWVHLPCPGPGMLGMMGAS